VQNLQLQHEDHHTGLVGVVLKRVSISLTLNEKKFASQPIIVRRCPNPCSPI